MTAYMAATPAPRRYAIRDWNGTEQPVTFAELLSQVTALCAHSTDLDIDAAKRSGLRKRKGSPKARPVLTDPAARAKKLAVETGFDHRLNTFLRAPLEPWTCPSPDGMRLYGQIMRGGDGASLIGDYAGDDLAALEWMRDEELIAFGDLGEVHALGDALPRERRTYPGASCSDKTARVGRQLRDMGRKLVVAAFTNIVRRRTRKRISPRKRVAMDRPHGICLSAYDLCREVNAIKSRQRDLDSYRYLSVDTCRRIARDLLAAGILTEAEPPKPIRIRRSWHTVPRVFEIPAELDTTRRQSKRRVT